MTKELVANALFRAVAIKRPPEGLVLQSDRVSQLFSQLHQGSKAVWHESVYESQGNCYDNAPMESFGGTLKTEHQLI